ncbi:MAG: biopolymer transporter ExbD [Cytophagaceae bacterium]|nr:biopolymer transporter ExbD [Cytophagaceae bacterium]
MPKIKVPRKNISLDMTAMCDMAFLLLTFFILSTKMNVVEPVAVDIPSSTAKKEVPADSLMMISVDKEGKIYFGIDNQNQRLKLIDLVAQRVKIPLTDAEKHRFSTLESAGIPFGQLKMFLNKPGDKIMKDQPGIPADSLKNELILWVGLAKEINPMLRITVKGDRDSNFEHTKKIIDALQSLNLHHLSFVTNLETKPEVRR